MIDRLTYRAKLLATPKIKAFLGLIENTTELVEGIEVVDSDEVYLGFLKALRNSDKLAFKTLYDSFSQRVPDQRSPFVRDDYLLFVILCGVSKFSIDTTWLQKVLDCRSCTTEECTQTIDTFKSLLRSDTENTSNMTSIIVLFQYLLDRPLLQNDLGRTMYINYVASEFPFYKSDFLNLTALRAIDIILLAADIADNGKSIFLKKFEEKFLKRTHILAFIVYYSLMLFLIFIAVWNYNDYKGITEILNTVVGFLGFFGLVLPNIISKEKTVYFFEKNIRRLFGHTTKQ